MGKYGNATLYLLTIPENFTDLYKLPETVMNQLREIICNPLEITIEDPSKVSVFIYYNNTFVIQSFNDKPVSLNIVSENNEKNIVDLLHKTKLSAEKREGIKRRERIIVPDKYIYEIELPTRSSGVYRINE